MNKQDNTRKKSKRTKYIAFALALLNIVLIFCISFADKLNLAVIPSWNDLYVAVGGIPNPDGLTKFEFMDVGQGDCELIASNNEYMLIDSGTSISDEELYKQLKQRGITKIDYLVITHPHADHMGGATYLVEEMEIGKIIMQEYTPNSPEDLAVYEEFKSTVERYGIPIETPQNGQKIALGEVEVTLHVPNWQQENENNNSIVVKAVHKGHSVVYMGDAEKEEEQYLMQNNIDLDCDVLKIGHHGSKTSTSEEFLEYTSPSIAVISAGKNNQFNHPSDEVSERLYNNKIQIFRTDLYGTVSMQFGDDYIEVSAQNLQ